MANNLGKEFEARLKRDWEDTVPNSFIYRLKDVTMGYKFIGNVSDFVAYKKPDMFLIEAKSHKGNTFPFSAFRQYKELTEYDNIEGLHPGVILWMIDHNLVLWIPIQTFEKLEAEGKKSFNVKYIDDYECLVIPSDKRRVFMRSDYSALINYYKEK